MKTALHTASRRHRQKGVVLFTALILLLILTLVGVLLARSESVEENISENDQDHQLAIQAAEATLRYAEANLYTGNYTNFSGNANGQYTWQNGTADWFQTYNLSSPAALMTYGTYSGNSLLAAPPEFMIESMPAASLPGQALGQSVYNPPTPPIQVYRITSYSYGGDMSATAELQEIDLQ